MSQQSGERQAERQVPGDGPAQSFALLNTLFNLVTTRPRRAEAISHFEAFGLRAARILVRHSGRQDTLFVDRIDVTTERVRGGRRLTGEIQLGNSAAQPITFEMQPSWMAEASRRPRTGTGAGSRVDQGFANIRVASAGLRPSRMSALTQIFPTLQVLTGDVGFAFDLNLSAGGQIENSRLELRAGRVDPDLSQSARTVPNNAAGRLTQAVVDLAYDRARGRIEMAPSRFRGTGFDMTIAATLTPIRRPGASGGWTFVVNGVEGRIGIAKPGAPNASVAVETLEVRGRYEADTGWLRLQQAQVALDGGSVATLAGSVHIQDPKRHNFIAELADLPADLIGKIWPVGVLHDVRAWFVANVARGVVQRARLTSQFPRDGGWLPSGGAVQTDAGWTTATRAASVNTPQISGTFELVDLKFRGLQSLPWITGQRARARIEGDTLEVTADAATLVIPDAPDAQLSDLSYRQVRVWNGDRGAVVGVRVASRVRSAIAMLSADPFGIEPGDILRRGARGELAADLKMALASPIAIAEAASRGAAVWPVVTGTAEVRKGTLRARGLPHQLEKTELELKAGAKAIAVTGRTSLAGVPLTVNWQHFLKSRDGPDWDRSARQAGSETGAAGTAPRAQPPLRLMVKLDGAARSKLGLRTGDIVSGHAAVEVQIRDIAREPKISVSVDLNDAAMKLESLGWSKPVGRSARLEFSVEPQANRTTKLTNLRLVGDRVAIRGDAQLDRRGRLVAFSLPQFSLDLVSRLALKGRLKDGTGEQPDRWQISVDGAVIDGRDFFRSLFAAETTSAPAPGVRLGVDLEAEIETVIGFNDLSLSKVKLSLTKREGRLTSLSARAKLAGDDQLDVVIERISGVRRLLATSTNAGQTFRIVDFYPSIRGGQLRLRMDLDGANADQRFGVLDIHDFQIVNNRILRTVIRSNESGQPAIARRRNARSPAADAVSLQDVIEFDRLRAPFGVGNGQFVINDADLVGPLIGGSLRGKADFARRNLFFSGTYAYLQGLNSLPKFLPGIGQLLTGMRQEGISAVTFAVQGAMSAPETVLNPFSPFAIGILRELTELAPVQKQFLPNGQPPSKGISTLQRGPAFEGQRGSRGWSATTDR
ncbi:MAG: AsmA-like C-terminal region-containing protein [Pseudomonadota bacterium]